MQRSLNWKRIKMVYNEVSNFSKIHSFKLMNCRQKLKLLVLNYNYDFLDLIKMDFRFVNVEIHSPMITVLRNGLILIK